ncbi:hypothetical protein F3Y22_tig00111769pilonHSYRG00556 [Hibiscus syriacus]|uniref:RING-type domain-containing protein n=1 Tax=Hibiscus syriacus TaxID=106335 RepID=A0A6A2XW24_HIBSY|nr:hypothetical protein F3Y22_tig00111769pilonHSYRG00556 [Hibiscus syriacus]
MISVNSVSSASLVVVVVVGGCFRFSKWCGHGFHDGCIDAWLKVGTTCPIAGLTSSLTEALSFLPWFLGKRVVKWIENPLSSEITLAFCESVGYV